MARKGSAERGIVRRVLKDGTVVWYARLYHEGREPWFGPFNTKTKARDCYQRMKVDQSEGRFFPERYQRGTATLEDVIESYMVNNANKTAKQDRRYADFWKGWFPGATLRAITPAAIEKAKLHLSQKSVGKKEDRLLTPQTVFHYLKFLRHVLNIAVRDGKLERNPMSKVSLPKLTKGKTRFLSLEEEGKLAAALGPSYASWVRLAILTGLRREEQFGLRWADVNIEQGVLTIPQTKAGGVRYVRLNEEAKAILRGMDSWLRSAWVFPSQKPATHLDSDNFYQRVYLKAVKQARLEGITWHTLRHTFASRLAMSGATEQDIAAALGHSTTALVKRYAHLSPAHLQGVMEKVSAFGKPNVGGTQNGLISESNRDGFEIRESVVAGSGAQVIEKVGAGDGI